MARIRAFPIPVYPLIAPYHADVLTETSGSVWYRSTQDPMLLAKAESDVVIESVIAPTTLAVLRQGYFNLFSSQLHSVYIFIRD